VRAAGWPEPEVFSWVDVLDGVTPSGVVRLDSPGRSWNTERRLLLLGATENSGNGWISREQVGAMGEPAGRIVAMPQWHAGWCRALGDLRSRTPDAMYLNAPEDVAILFDKQQTQERLEAGGCRMPRSLGVPSSFDDLLARMHAARCPRVFLKACHGSSASGVVALETSRANIQAFTTARWVGGFLWNQRPIQQVRELSMIAAIVDAICRQHAQAQAWVPKMGWRGHRIDLRIVTIGGRARHAVVRMSQTPMTNLQLHNRRGDLAAFAQEHGDGLGRARVEAERAAAAFPQCLTLGVDVALDPAGRAWVLEANAFGDLLPGCLVDGWDTYRWQVEALRQRQVSRIG
jgi:hypothetical protein